MAGPAGLLICFIVVGTLLWTVTQSLGEMGAFISVSGQYQFLLPGENATGLSNLKFIGSFTHYTSRFVDPALGFALGWNYFLVWSGVIIANYSMKDKNPQGRDQANSISDNLALILGFWESRMPTWGWILIFW